MSGIKYLNFSANSKKGAPIIKKLNKAAQLDRRSPHDLAWLILDEGLDRLIKDRSQTQSAKAG